MEVRGSSPLAPTSPNRRRTQHLTRIARGLLVGALAAVLAACDATPDETVVLRLTARAATAVVSQPAPAAPTPDASPRAAADMPAQPLTTPERTPPAAPTPTATPVPSPTPTPPPTPTPLPTPPVIVDLDGARGRLVAVIDGDTFTVETPSGEVAVRILGIDAPEFNDDGQRKLAEEARQALRDLIGAGPLRLVADVEPADGGGRLLRHVYRTDRLLAVELARRGWARALPVPPNLAQREAIDRAVAEARVADRGLWALGAASLSLEVDKVGEVATLTNTGSTPLDIGGWWLVSLRGRQVYRFPPRTPIAPGAVLRVVSGEAPGAHRFTQRSVWNNTSPDPAELRRADGRVVAVWDDPASR